MVAGYATIFLKEGDRETMAKLYFKYGQMNASKSMQLLSIAHNYEEQGKTPLLLTPAIDDRYIVGKITSRIGISKNAYAIGENDDIFKVVKTTMPDCVLIDEAQFLSKAHILQLVQVVKDLHIPVIAFGLKNDFKNELFEGSKYLLIYAHEIEEIKTICHFCDRKATMILKYKDGKPVYDGEQIEIGGNELYKSVCMWHYYEPVSIN